MEKKQTYREILQAELAQRCKRNSRYSQRSFAKDLNFYPGRLNEVLLGKKGLSKTAALQIAKRLNYTNEESQYFCDLVTVADGRSAAEREFAKVRLGKYTYADRFQVLQAETFKMISEWYHLAIIELMELKSFKSDPVWIAKALGISTVEVQQALKRLAKLQLIEIGANGYVSVGAQTVTQAEISSESVRLFHEQVLGKASRGLIQQDPKASEYSSTFLAINSRRIPEAKEMIKLFWKDLSKKLQTDQSKDSLYCLSTQFFNLLERV